MQTRDATSWGQAAVPRPTLQTFQWSAEESAILLRILSDSLRVNRHYELLQWLTGDLQLFLPHRILISAWGDFTRRDVRLDVVSVLPGVRTGQLGACRIDDLVMRCYAQWMDAGRQPLVWMGAGTAGAPHARCACPIHAELRGMRSVLAHGFRDQRSGFESLYICLNAASFTRGRCKQEFLSVVHLLMGPIDAAFRRVAALPPDAARPEPGGSAFDLSPREREILLCLCQGKSNAAIAATLAISPFTVKNHLQRVFDKMGARSRTEAVALYNEALAMSGKAAGR